VRLRCRTDVALCLSAPRRSVREELEQREARVRAHVNELEALASQHEDAHAVRGAWSR